jgi:transcriptional regulator with XRE-family HTH domain
MGGRSEVAAFGRTLRRARRERDLSQDALALRAGVGVKHLSDLERGNKEPRLTTLLRLAGGLGLTGAELVGLYESAGEEEAPRPPAGAPPVPKSDTPTN